MISVIIPTYKNKKQFFINLNHNFLYLKNCEIIIVNDNPKIDFTSQLKTLKNVKIINNPVNKGFGESINIGVKHAKNRYIMLLNDDVLLLNDLYKLAISYFQKDNNLFAVGFAQKEKDGTTVGKNTFFWKQGIFFHQKADNLSFGETSWAEGGACMIDKKKFDALGGFDPIYSPFYWEDIDLSYQAKKAGYKVIFDPKIIVKHHHQSTISKYFSKNFVKTIAFRNQFLFMWKNATAKEKIIHFLFLPFNILYYLFKGEFSFVKGLIQAIKNLNKNRQRNIIHRVN